jgi:hypothetical protein
MVLTGARMMGQREARGTPDILEPADSICQSVCNLHKIISNGKATSPANMQTTYLGYLLALVAPDPP